MKQMTKSHSLAHLLACATLGAGLMAVSTPASAGLRDAFGSRASAQEQSKNGQAEIPVCSKPLGTIAVIEPEDVVNWWSGEQLPAPSRLIKVFVSKSKCFTLVDRGVGLAASQAERALAADGELRGRSNIGKGQMRAADYVLIPDLISQNSDAGGNAIGGLISGLVGSKAGSVASGLNLRSKTANVTLSLTDVRSSEQVAVVEGNSKKTDLSWGARGSLFGGGGLGGMGVGGYANTEIGQVITLAYLQAYTNLVGELGGLSGNPAASNVSQAVTMLKPGRLLANAKGTGAAVRSLEPGMLLYPTGVKEGAMWEVEDEMGNKGWVNATLMELAR